MVGKCDDTLGEAFGAGEVELTSLFRKIFEPRTMYNFQKYFAWQCCGEVAGWR